MGWIDLKIKGDEEALSKLVDFMSASTTLSFHRFNKNGLAEALVKSL